MTQIDVVCNLWMGEFSSIPFQSFRIECAVQTDLCEWHGTFARLWHADTFAFADKCTPNVCELDTCQWKERWPYSLITCISHLFYYYLLDGRRHQINLLWVVTWYCGGSGGGGGVDAGGGSGQMRMCRSEKCASKSTKDATQLADGSINRLFTYLCQSKVFDSVQSARARTTVDANPNVNRINDKSDNCLFNRIC